MENSSNYLREHQIVKFNREASNATKNTKLARVKPARDRDRVGCFIPHRNIVVYYGLLLCTANLVSHNMHRSLKIFVLY